MNMNAPNVVAFPSFLKGWRKRNLSGNAMPVEVKI
jgi:hypothetical protein